MKKRGGHSSQGPADYTTVPSPQLSPAGGCPLLEHPILWLLTGTSWQGSLTDITSLISSLLLLGGTAVNG